MSADRDALRRLSGACAACLVGSAAVGSLVSALFSFLPNAQAVRLLGGAAGLLIPFGLLARTVRCERIDPPQERMPQRSLALLFFGAIGCGRSLSLGLWLLLSRLGLDHSEPAVPLGGPSLAFYAANVLLVAPLLEEWAFRGVLLRVLQRFGRRFALVTSAALFALLHMPPARWPLAFCSGLALAFCAEQTGGLLFPILLHFAHNALGLWLLQNDLPVPFLLGALAAAASLPVLRAARPSLPGPQAAGQFSAFFLTPAMLLALACILFLEVTA